MALTDCDPAVLEALRAVYREHVPEKTAAEVRKTGWLGWPGSWANAGLARNLGQLQPFLAAFPRECMGQLASFGPS